MTRSYENLECMRCGNQWYSPEFERSSKLPKYCPKCYRDSVREIPEPPTKIDLMREDIIKRKESIPALVEEKRHRLKLKIENNRALISMIVTGTLMTSIISAMVYLMFFI